MSCQGCIIKANGVHDLKLGEILGWTPKKQQKFDRKKFSPHRVGGFEIFGLFFEKTLTFLKTSKICLQLFPAQKLFLTIFKSFFLCLLISTALILTENTRIFADFWNFSAAQWGVYGVHEPIQSGKSIFETNLRNQSENFAQFSENFRKKSWNQSAKPIWKFPKKSYHSRLLIVKKKWSLVLKKNELEFVTPHFFGKFVESIFGKLTAKSKKFIFFPKQEFIFFSW